MLLTASVESTLANGKLIWPRLAGRASQRKMLAVSCLTFWALGAGPAVGQNETGADSISVPASVAIGIGLGAAAQYRTLTDQQWRDYEDLLAIAILNTANKMAANAGQPMTSGDYDSIVSLIRTQLDASAPSAALFQSQDEATRLRYGIDALSTLASSPQAGKLLPKVYSR